MAPQIVNTVIRQIGVNKKTQDEDNPFFNQRTFHKHSSGSYPKVIIYNPYTLTQETNPKLQTRSLYNECFKQPKLLLIITINRLSILKTRCLQIMVENEPWYHYGSHLCQTHKQRETDVCYCIGQQIDEVILNHLIESNLETENRFGYFI